MRRTWTGALTANSTGEGGATSGRLRLRRRSDGLALGRIDVALHRRRHHLIVVEGWVHHSANLVHWAPRPARHAGSWTFRFHGDAETTLKLSFGWEEQSLWDSAATSDVTVRWAGGFIGTRNPAHAQWSMPETNQSSSSVASLIFPQPAPSAFGLNASLVN